MFGGGIGPATLLANALDHLERQIPGLRDGSEEAIHDARVAIRRLREALVLSRAHLDEDELNDVDARLRSVFRALGRARDADVAQRLVEHVEARFPMAPATIGHLRVSVGRAQLAARRKAIKRLESADMGELITRLRRAPHTPVLFRRDPSWRRLLRNHISSRGSDLLGALDHASGVYFPNRTHSARVSLKQLRYALELGSVTGTFRVPRAMRTLRRAQDALGEAHDREVLLARLGRLEEEEGVSLERGEVRSIEHFLQGEIHELHRAFVDARPQLREICAACENAVQVSHLPRRALAAASLALPVVYLLRR